MTANSPKMTIETARQIISEYGKPCYCKSDWDSDEYDKAQGYIQAFDEVVKEAEKFIPHMRHHIDCGMLCCDRCDCGYEEVLNNWQSFKQGGKNG